MAAHFESSDGKALLQKSISTYKELPELWDVHSDSYMKKQPSSMVSRRALFLVQYCSQFTLVHLLFFWKLMELAITFLQMTLNCTSGLKIWMKPNIGFHLSCLT